MRRLVSRPGIEAYCGRSLVVSHEGGLFHPGTMVEPLAGVGGDDTFGASVAGAAGLSGTAFVGAVVGGGRAAWASGSAPGGTPRARPRTRAPPGGPRACPTDPPCFFS